MYDDCDGRDNELLEVLYRGANLFPEMRDGAMSRVIGSTRPTKGDADAKSAPFILLQMYPLLLS
jgi:hypothetical protein